MMNNIMGFLGFREKEEEPNARGRGRRRGETEMLREHEMEVVGGGEGDKRVESGVREVIFEGKGGFNGKDS